MKKWNLQMYAGSLTVTMLKDGHTSTATATPSSSLSKNDTVELTLEFGSGYELDEIEVISGGVTLEEEAGDWSFKMGEADVVLYVKSKSATTYMVMEPIYAAVNGTVTKVNPNVTLKYGKNGMIIAVDSQGTSLSSLSADILAALVESGAVVKM